MPVTIKHLIQFHNSFSVIKSIAYNSTVTEALNVPCMIPDSCSIHVGPYFLASIYQESTIYMKCHHYAHIPVT